MSILRATPGSASSSTRLPRDGGPYNAEPHKCASIQWFQMDQLPDNTMPYSRARVELFRRGEPFGFKA